MSGEKASPRPILGHDIQTAKPASQLATQALIHRIKISLGSKVFDHGSRITGQQIIPDFIDPRLCHRYTHHSTEQFSFLPIEE
jgi:hypothetical protein